MVETPSLIVTLRRTYRYQGKTYGPGEDIEVPYGLAASLGLLPRTATAQATQQPTQQAVSHIDGELQALADSEDIGRPPAAEKARRGRKPKTTANAAKVD